MPKDAKGHGSNPRGGGKDQRGLEKRHGLKPGNLADPRARAAYRASEALHKGDFVAADAIRRSVGLPGGNADRAAASQLASGPKSAPVPVHEAMQDGNHRAVPARPVSGSPAWHGEFHDGVKWQRVKNQSGRPISYTTPEHARNGAVFTRGRK